MQNAPVGTPVIATIPAGHTTDSTQRSPSARRPPGHALGTPPHALRLGTQNCPGQQQCMILLDLCKPLNNSSQTR